MFFKKLIDVVERRQAIEFIILQKETRNIKKKLIKTEIPPGFFKKIKHTSIFIQVIKGNKNGLLIWDYQWLFGTQFLTFGWF